MSFDSLTMEPFIRSLREADLAEANRIFRLSFGTFLGLADPMSFYGDTDYIHTRFRADPSLSFAAEVDGSLVGSNFIANWGSVGIFGPLTVHPDYWDKGIARLLLDKTMEMFKELMTKHVGLFTFSQSPKHVHLYQKYDFWPRYLTAVMSKTIKPIQTNKESKENIDWAKYSDIQKDEISSVLDNCYSLTDSIYNGLNLKIEIESVANQKLGDTIILMDNKTDILSGLAICHCGPHTEAGSNTCYIKFGSVKPNEDKSEATNFENLLDYCEYYAASRGLSKLTAGVNIGNLAAYRTMISKGFRTESQGVLMTKNNEPGYHVQDIYAIDDWR
ncbi:MAG TPA: GNAT family N-acetyltransferase [Nitrososphaeraceae archaeon]|jgi:GNAT superfamily N-acetyltransferase|nr:GNAT family N-acetyltransferase [Nitrososphaeraceae archaeon]